VRGDQSVEEGSNKDNKRAVIFGSNTFADAELGTAGGSFSQRAIVVEDQVTEWR
jgi:hypothetical protein